jgi:hypothetical protein
MATSEQKTNGTKREIDRSTGAQIENMLNATESKMGGLVGKLANPARREWLDVEMASKIRKRLTDITGLIGQVQSMLDTHAPNE